MTASRRSRIWPRRLRFPTPRRHESLIALSNAKYYAGELVTFPSPVTRDNAVRYVHVEGGVYERGGSKTNRKEAQAVVGEVINPLVTLLVEKISLIMRSFIEQHVTR